MARILRFLPADEGAVSLEYGLIAALVAIGVLVALTQVGQSLESRFSDIDGGVRGAL